MIDNSDKFLVENDAAAFIRKSYGGQVTIQMELQPMTGG
jgi:hypothetical protein